jgi:hypothetical protein
VTIATPTRALRDVLVERLRTNESKVPGPSLHVQWDDGVSALVFGMTGAWFGDDRDELRASEVAWLQALETEAIDAAEEAAITAAVAVLEAGLRRLAEGGETVPAHLLEQGPDELREDVELVPDLPA